MELRWKFAMGPNVLSRRHKYWSVMASLDFALSWKNAIVFNKEQTQE